MFRKLILSSIALFCLITTNVSAVGLGEIEQSSGLNQPLKAEIPLLSAGDLADYEVLATLGSNLEFEKFGVDRVFFLNNIKFNTVRNSAGQIVISLSTKMPIKEPFLNFVIALNWPNGRILREYTLLLDPPVFEEAASSTIEKTTSDRPNQYQPRPSAQAPTQTESNTPSSRYSPSENSQTSYTGSIAGRYGPVKANDTLWSIATRARPNNSVTIHQTLVAIYRANPDAFSNGNINNLLKGKVLNIPDVDTIASVPQRAALQDVVMQNRQWRSGGKRKIVDRTGDNRASRTAGTAGARLSLSASEEEGNSQGYGSDSAKLNETRNQLVRSQEEAATLQAENDALRARLDDILNAAENAEDNSAVEIEDAELAALSQSDQSDDEALNDDNPTDSESNDGTILTDQQDDSTEQSEGGLVGDELPDNELAGEGTVDSNELADDELTNDGMTDPEGVDTVDTDMGAEADNSSEAGAEQSGAEQSSTENEPVTEKTPKVETKETNLIDQILADKTLLWGGLGGLVLLILLIVFWRMKKRMGDDEFHDDLVSSAGSGSMDTTETFELPDVGDDMLVELDMDDDEGVAGTDGESFDPIGEADIYIAYGKHEQAEKLLLEAIEDNPVRADLKVKLMECYAESDAREKFDQLAVEVSEAIDSDEWVEQIHSLRTQAWGEEQGEEGEDDFDLPSTEDIFGGDDDELDVDFDEEISEPTKATRSEAKATPKNEEAIENLDQADSLDKSGKDAENLDATDDDDDFSLDMDDIDDDALDGLDSLETTDDEEISLEIEDDFAFDEDDSSIDFDENLDEEGDEIATKLDLARAYVDMGDSDGAKEILKEVISEGTENQKIEAQKLIDQTN